MARIVHLSDIHFGAHDPRLVAAVERSVDDLKPDLVVISGDFTQRAKTEEFEEACQFLARLRDRGHEVIGVPGNHDVPLYDVLRRFMSPLTRYKRYIDDVLCPVHELRGAIVVGINTARSLTFKDGRINEEQVAFIRDTFARSNADSVRVLVTHHPLFALPVGDHVHSAIGRQEMALDAVEDAGVDLLLAGHNHHASVNSAAELVTRAGGALVVQAGTATSTRVRDQDQSFNLLDIGPGHIVLTVYGWGGEDYRPADAQAFEQREGLWALVHTPQPAA